VSKTDGKTGSKKEKIGVKKMNCNNRMIQRAMTDFSAEQVYVLGNPKPWSARRIIPLVSIQTINYDEQ
jgi:hypothetical protein